MWSHTQPSLQYVQMINIHIWIHISLFWGGGEVSEKSNFLWFDYISNHQISSITCQWCEMPFNYFTVWKIIRTKTKHFHFMSKSSLLFKSSWDSFHFALKKNSANSFWIYSKWIRCVEWNSFTFNSNNNKISEKDEKLWNIQKAAVDLFFVAPSKN